MTDLAKLFDRQKDWSSKAFGDNPRIEGIMDHLRKETREVEENPDDIVEYADLLILTIDAAWRQGFSAQCLYAAAYEKMGINAQREWPPIEEQQPGKAVEHVRGFPEPSPRHDIK